MPLSDVTALERSGHPRGALCGRLLGELGADVVMVEPSDGHPLRSATGDASVDAHYFETFGVGKESLAVDDCRASPVVDDLLDAADVVVVDESPPPAGLGAERVHERDPSTVYCAVTPFGLSGPASDRPGGELAVQASAGLTGTSGFPDGAPAASAAPVAATFAAVVGCGSVIAALEADERECVLDLSTQDAVVPLLSTILPEYFATREPVARSGNQHPIAAPWNAYRADDGWVFFIAYIDRDWDRCIEMIDRPDLRGDERFETVADRREHAGDIDAVLEEWVADRTVEDVVAAAESHGLMAVAVSDVEAAFDDDNLAYRDMTVESGGHRIAGSPFALSRTPGRVGDPAPETDDWRADR